MEEFTSLCALCLSAPLRSNETVRTLGFAAEGQRSGESLAFEALVVTEHTILYGPSSDPSEHTPAHSSLAASESESGVAWLRVLESSSLICANYPSTLRSETAFLCPRIERSLLKHPLTKLPTNVFAFDISKSTLSALNGINCRVAVKTKGFSMLTD